MTFKKLIIIICIFYTKILTAQITEVINNLGKLGSMVIYDNNVYFSSSDNHTISKFDLTEETKEIVEIISGIEVSSLAVNGDYLYFGAVYDSKPAKIMRININEDESEIETIAHYSAYNMIFNDNTLYFTYPVSSSKNNIAKIDVNQPIISKIDLIFNIQSRYNRIPLAIKDNFLYFSSATKLSRFDITDISSQPETIKSLTGHSDCIIFNENDLYSNIDESGKIVKFDTSSKTLEKTTIINEGVNWTRSLAFHKKDLYIAYGFFNNQKIGKVNTTTLSLSGNEFIPSNEKYILLPNPTYNKIKILNLRQSKNYKIYDSLGKIIKEGIIYRNQFIDLEHFIRGTYYLKTDNKITFRFIKI
jgi:hypothetical protein